MGVRTQVSKPRRMDVLDVWKSQLRPWKTNSCSDELLVTGSAGSPSEACGPGFKESTHHTSAFSPSRLSAQKRGKSGPWWAREEDEEDREEESSEMLENCFRDLL